MSDEHSGGSKKVFIELVIVLALVILGLWSLNRSSAPATTTGGDTSTIPADGTSVGTVDVGAPAASISYTDALVKYKNARIQLDDHCQANAQSQKITVKNGSYIMIDNRAAVSRSVHVGSVYSIPAYGFKIVQISSAVLPATWHVDCGTSQNVSTITIQQ